MNASSAIQKLLDELERLPGVGPKSAQRIAYWILNEEKADALRLANSIIEVKDTDPFARDALIMLKEIFAISALPKNATIPSFAWYRSREISRR